MSQARFRTNTSTLAYLVLMLATPGVAHAQSATDNATVGAQPAADQASAGRLEEIVVTARKRIEDVQDVPLAVSAVSGKMLEQNQIHNVVDLQQIVPSLNYQTVGNNRNGGLSIRGIGSGSANGGVDPSVGVFYDGIYMPQAATALAVDFLDIAAIEVLRGPQGTIFGRNTPIGAINIRSRDPQHEFESEILAGHGNYNTNYVSAYVGGSVNEKLAGRVSFFINQHSGYDYNLYNGKHTNDSNRDGARLQLKWTPSDSFTGNLVAFYAHQRNECCVADIINGSAPGGLFVLYPQFTTVIRNAIGRPYLNTVTGDHKVDEALPPLEKNINSGAYFTGNLDLNNGYDLTSVSAYVSQWNDTPITGNIHNPLMTRQSQFHQERRSFSQELRLASPQDNAFNFLVGAYGFYEKQTFFNAVTVLSQANRLTAAGPLVNGDQNIQYFNQKNFAGALFGQINWSLTDKLKLTAGARYSYDRKTGRNWSPASVNIYTGAAAAASLAQTGLTPYDSGRLRTSQSTPSGMASLAYNVTDNFMTYFTASSGYQAAGFSGLRVVVGTPLTFGRMTTTNFELGFKSELFDRRLRLNVDVYQMNVKRFQDNLKEAAFNSFYVANAGDRRARGVEYDIEFHPFKELTLTASGAYLDSVYTDYDNGLCPAAGFRPANVTAGTVAGTCDFTGARPWNSPKWSGNVGFRWQSPLNSKMDFYLSPSLNYVSKYFGDTSTDTRAIQEGYSLLNAQIGIQSSSRQWRVSVWGKNLTNKSYMIQATAFTSSNFAAAPPPSTAAPAGAFFGWFNPPRTYGLEVNFRF